MNRRNDGIGESNILQNRFTAYFVKALRHRKIQYLRAWEKQRQTEHALEITDYAPDFAISPDILDGLPVLDQIENECLRRSLGHLKERERHILFSKALGNNTFVEISEELGIDYQAVTTTYYRTIKKARKNLRGEG